MFVSSAKQTSFNGLVMENVSLYFDKLFLFCTHGVEGLYCGHFVGQYS